MQYLTRTNDLRDDVKCTELINTISMFIKDHADAVVIGMSGGVDSTILTALSINALGKDSVVGLHLPAVSSDINGDKFNARSVKTAKHFGITNHSIDVGGACVDIINQINYGVLGYETSDKLTVGNLLCRFTSAGGRLGRGESESSGPQLKN